MAKKEQMEFQDLMQTISGGLGGMVSTPPENPSTSEKEPEEPRQRREKKKQKSNYTDYFEPTAKKQSVPVQVRLSGEIEQRLRRLHNLSKLKGYTLPFYAYLDNIIEKHVEQNKEAIKSFERSVMEGDDPENP